MRFLRVLVICICALSASAQAQLRTIPEQAKEGKMRHLQDMLVSINDVQMRLAPGAQIRDQANRLVVPTAVPPDTHVRYLLDEQGLVRQVWFLTPQEAANQAATNEAAKN